MVTILMTQFIMQMTVIVNLGKRTVMMKTVMMKTVMMETVMMKTVMKP